MKKARTQSTESPEEQEGRFEVVLASSSPRRRQILRNAGIRFRTKASHVVEGPRRVRERRSAYAIRLAMEKARSVVAGVSPGVVILAADTIVCVGGRILGKPSSRGEARRMLRLLSGRSHWVITGVALICPDTRQSFRWSERTRVTFSRLSKKNIEAYIDSGEPFDKAGAYAVQGLASKFVTRIEGCYFNVMGLPIASVSRELKRISEGRRK
ncbi:MAG: Maf family protein [Acidobacteriia bacterium]|nr:Maf family protein [Terriglobia bacterium]